MEEKKKNEEIQSRREFFKKAAKGALPILGAIALANLPLLSEASETEVGWGCSYGCSGGCKSGCGQSCSFSCSGGCKGGCGGACSYGCQNTCKGTCQGRCSGGCSSMSMY